MTPSPSALRDLQIGQDVRVTWVPPMLGQGCFSTQLQPPACPLTAPRPHLPWAHLGWGRGSVSSSLTSGHSVVHGNKSHLREQQS